MIKKYFPKVSVVEVLQLTWANWELMQDFVNVPKEAKGISLDDKGKETSTITGKLGLKFKDGRIAKMDDYVVKDSEGNFTFCSAEDFPSLYETRSQMEKRTV